MSCGGEKKAKSDSPAGAEPVEAAGATTPAVLLLCGADTISVQGGRGDTLQLNVNGESFLVGLVPSGSGARYQSASDTGTFFWNQGQRALVQVRGEALPECELIP
jgi:membrane-bound inhibitor of C-type lysozyme